MGRVAGRQERHGFELPRLAGGLDCGRALRRRGACAAAILAPARSGHRPPTAATSAGCPEELSQLNDPGPLAADAARLQPCNDRFQGQVSVEQAVAASHAHPGAAVGTIVGEANARRRSVSHLTTRDRVSRQARV